ncbi:hypothetical protein [Shewanella sp. AC91-MNA-CIBAN-0169]|uniref:hypothetical protein n=1 Tax=Shewanella sp. AC91-MNA-CIBAN-0169 TaxID=3140466 RepID=UPI00331A33BE
MEQVTAIYFLFAIVSSVLSAVVIIVDGTIDNFYIPIILCIGVFGSIANSYLYVCIVTKDKTNVLFISSFLTMGVLGSFLYFLTIDSTVLALLFAISFNALDFLFKWIFLRRYKFKVSFDFSNLQLSKPMLLICGLTINGILFLVQRMALARVENGMEQMAYLEIVMQAFSLIAVFLSSQSNYLMGRKSIKFLKREFTASKLMLLLTLSSSTLYALIVLFGRNAFSWVFDIELTQALCTAAALMIFCYSIAFYSVRIAISKNMQKVTLNSTILSSGAAFIPYLFLDFSALSIVYSYSIFYFSLCVFNGLFMFRGDYEVKKDVA